MASAVRFRTIMEELYDVDERRELEESYQDSVTGDYSADELDPFVTDICKLKAEWSQISFSSGSHTAQPVMVYALGKGAESFSGLYDNTEIYLKLMEAMGLANQK